MAGNKLEVGIGADITDFSRKIKEVERDLSELSKIKVERLKLGLDTAEINMQIKDVKNSLRDLKTTSKDVNGALGSTGTAMGNFGKQTANGGTALTAFSRIAQDAPYGIIGIGNNITNTAEQFGYLVKQTGSAGGAFKALGQSLLGTGGVLLAVSLVTTAFTVMAQQGLSVGDVIDKLTGNFDEYSAALNKIAVDSAKSSGTEIASLKALEAVAQDETQSRNARLLAVKELQDTYPAYFGNMTKEQILTGNLTTVTNELAKAIIAKAEASALSEKIGELASKKLELQIKKEKEIINLQKSQSNVKAAQENLSTANNIAGAGQRAAGAAGALAINASKVKDLNQEIYEIQVLQDKLAGRLNDKTSQSILLNTEKAKAVKTSTVFNTPTVSGVQSNLISAPLFNLNSVAVFNGQVDEFGNKVKTLPGVIETSMKLPGGFAKPFTDEFTRLQEALIEFDANVNKIIESSIVSTFGNLGSVIGEALANGTNVLQAVGNSLLQSLGGLLSMLGEELIKLGVAAVLAGTVVQLFGTITGIGAGLAAIAGGVALKGLGAAIGQSSNERVKGETSPSSRGGSNSNFSTNTGGFSSTSSGGGTVVFEIAGQKLIGVLNNTLNGNRRLGGQLALG